jgi:O-antigen/teichoic acid export membrane protein
MTESSSNTALGNIARGFLTSFSIQVIGKAFTLVATLAITRKLGASVYGSLSLGSSVTSLVLIVATLGLSNGLARHIGVADSQNESIKYYLAGTAVSLTVAVILGGVMFVFAEHLSMSLFGTGSVSVFLRALGAALPLRVLYNLTISASRGFNHSLPRPLFSSLLKPVLRTGLFVGVILAGFGDQGLAAAIFILYFVLSLSILLYLKLIILPEFSLFGISQIIPKQSHFKTLLVFSLPLMFSKGIWTLMINVDTILVGYFLSEEIVALYTISFSLSVLMKMIPRAMGNLFLPNVSSLYEKNELTKLREAYRYSTKWQVIFGIPFLIGFIGFPTQILTLFGDGFNQASPALQILTLGIFSSLVSGLNIHTLQAINEPRLVLYSQFIVVCINILLNIVLIQQMGFIGAAVATAFAYLSLNFLVNYYLYQKLRVFPVSLPFILVTIAFVVIVITFPYFVPMLQLNLFGAITYGGVCYVGYIGLAIILKFISIKDITETISQVRG